MMCVVRMESKDDEDENDMVKEKGMSESFNH